MPHLITNMSERQVNPIFPSKKNQTTPCQQKRGRTAQKKTTAIPKTYDAIKSAAGADMKVKDKKC